MTGYGASTFQLGDTVITIEIRSVNHRFLDIIPKYPRTFLYAEDKIKKILKSYFSRGRIELHIDMEGSTFINKTVVTDWNLMDQVMEQLQQAKERYGLSDAHSSSLLAQLPELMTITENETKPSELQEKLLTGIKEACAQVLHMRMEEGENLLSDILGRVKTVHHMVLLLEGRREQVIEEYQARIKKRIETYVDDSISLDAARLHQEIAILAEKGDISEEITRLLSHLQQIESICTSDQPIGRKLDFIIQEMNREANTIGSKSTDHKIGEWTVAMKSEIEKMKEQVQNIE